MAKRGLGSPKVDPKMREEIARKGGRASHGGGRKRKGGQSSKGYEEMMDEDKGRMGGM